MKKCKFCNHSGYTEKGEQVCTKYLLYIGEDKEELPCCGFEMTASWEMIVFWAGCVLCLIIIVAIL